MSKEILVVEDEEDIVDLLYDIFDGLVDYDTLYARDGCEALTIARVNLPDIILLDIQLPGLDGYEVCRRIRSDPAMSRIRVLMISGMAQNSDRKEALEAGADGFLNKPFTSTELIEKVEALLRSDGRDEWNRELQ